RWLKFVKYLREFGWEPIVFTPENPETPVDDETLLKEVPVGIQVVKNRIWEPYSVYKTLTGRKSEKIQTAFLKEKKGSGGLLESFSVWIRGNLFIPDARKFWIKPSVKYLKDILQTERVDAIISTGPPHSTHLIAMKLKQELGLPWLADFRDPWTNIDYYQDLRLGKRADKIHHQLEKKVLQQADAVTVVSPGMVKDFSAIVDRNYHFIPNGFDAEDLQVAKKKIEVDKHFSITHIGSLTKSRNPEKLWQVLGELVHEKEDFSKDLKIHNIGKLDFSVKETIGQNGLEKFLQLTDYLPHNEVITKQQEAAVLLLLINNTPNANLILTGKIFEYLTSKRPIICIAPIDGDAANIIRETGSGEVFDFSEAKKLKDYILKLYELFKKGKLAAESQNIERFERKNLTGDLVKVLGELTA
ncbi:MAG TPA: glycosyltransferase, partial [Bacteroidales bacterium]